MKKRAGQNLNLGDFTFKGETFPDLDQIFSQFKTPSFLRLNGHEKNKIVGQILAKLVLSKEGASFLLKAVIEFINRINHENILENYTFSSFEFYLNQFSDLNFEENMAIRGRIAGKFIPRDAYQIYFPIGMGKSYKGTHFVTAHMSPDLDTLVASFWGWMDAFAARVSDGLHIWNIPGGPPYQQIEVKILFQDFFGENIFDLISKNRLSLTLTSLDLLTQSGMNKKSSQELALNFDHERGRSAIILVDDKGFYLGDWRAIDVEGVRQIVMNFNNCLMWIESNFHIQLISCFAKAHLTVDHVSKVIRDLLDMKLGLCHSCKELPPTHIKFVNDYLVKALCIEKGLEATFEEFALNMEKLGVVKFTQMIKWLRSLTLSDLFDTSGKLTENRPKIFNQLEVLVKMLSEAFRAIRLFVDRLEIAFKIKTEVFGFIPQYLTHRTNVDEIRAKMGNYSYMTVNHTGVDGHKVPIGVIHAVDLQREPLGTVTLRDFCNREEMNIPSYLEVISVIDHHKSTLSTEMPPRAIIGDAQSSNALVAEMAFKVNDQYSTGGMTLEEVEAQLKELQNDLRSAQAIRCYQRLLQRKKVLQKNLSYFIDPQREFIEYFHFVYAILDDTDLLTKVSRLDVEVMASLLNRLKSLHLKKEVEIIHFDGIQEDESFTCKAASALLKNQDFYSLYSKVYIHKENCVEEELKQCVKGLESSVFSDVKVLNVRNRVSQTKIFARNYSTFEKKRFKLYEIWYQKSQDFYDHSHEVLIYLHMISTITSADDLFKGKEISYWHLDELWIWIPNIELAIEGLKLFLSSFRSSPWSEHVKKIIIEFLGKRAEEYSLIFKESFIKNPGRIDIKISKEKKLPVTILRFDAGTLNSRKGQIAPYLPRLSR